MTDELDNRSDAGISWSIEDLPSICWHEDCLDTPSISVMAKYGLEPWPFYDSCYAHVGCAVMELQRQAPEGTEQLFLTMQIHPQ
jgi:hypothetical protein